MMLCGTACTCVCGGGGGRGEGGGESGGWGQTCIETIHPSLSSTEMVGRLG